MGHCHIPMYHRAVTWTSDVIYICAIGLRGLKGTLPGVVPLVYNQHVVF